MCPNPARVLQSTPPSHSVEVAEGVEGAEEATAEVVVETQILEPQIILQLKPHPKLPTQQQGPTRDHVMLQLKAQTTNCVKSIINGGKTEATVPRPGSVQ